MRVASCCSLLWLFIPSLCVVFLVRWQYLGRAPALSQWVFTWWSRAASLCLNRLSCRVCPSPSLWRPGEAQIHIGYHCVTHLCLTENAKYYGIKKLSEVYFWGGCGLLSSCCIQTRPTDFKLNCNFVFLRRLPRHDALKLGKGFAKQTNCSVSNIVCLLSLTPQAVLAAQMKTSRAPQTPAYARQI